MEEKEKKFKRTPTKVFPWELAWVKKPDANNIDDVEAIEHIGTQSEVEKWMIGPSLTKEDFEEENFYGVCSTENEKGMDGFVYLYGPDEETINILKERKLIDFSNGKKILEISFARYVQSDLPVEKQKKGIISSAVRQICYSLIKDQEIEIVAFNDPKNLLSEITLKSAGFVIKGMAPYDKDAEKRSQEDNFWVLDKRELERILKEKRDKILRKE